MKKFLSVVLALSMLFALSACGAKSKYQKGVEALNNGQYSEAREIFAEITDYEDSAEKYRLAGFGMFKDYVEDKGELPLENLSNGKITTSENGLIISMGSGKSTDAVYFSWQMEVLPDSNMANVTVESKIDGLGALAIEKGKGQIDISSYNSGDEIKLDDYTIEGHKVDGSPLNSDFEGTGLIGLNNKLGDAISAVKALLSESGLDVTIDDIGFKNF